MNRQFDAGVEAEIRRFRRRLDSLTGICNIRQSGPQTVDFTIGFPTNPPVKDNNRLGSVGDSSVAINSRGKVDMFTLRFPPLPASIFSDGSVRHLMKNVVNDDELEYLEIQVNPGDDKDETEEWWPHLLLIHTKPMSLDDVGTLLENTVPKYLKMSRKEIERMKSE